MIGFLRMFRVRVDNRLDLGRYYVDGPDNLAEPVPFDTNTGSIDLEFDYAAVVDTYVVDPFEDGDLVSLELSGVRDAHSFRLWIPYVFLDNVQVTGGVEGSATATVTAGVRYEPSVSHHAVQLDLVTDGSHI